jgi:S-(hydroxymethyl)glutathione dehydrogenase/alcohol dehydrogenase
MGGVADIDVTRNVAGLTLLQKNLQGSIFGHDKPRHDIPMLLSLYQASSTSTIR